MEEEGGILWRLKEAIKKIYGGLEWVEDGSRMLAGKSGHGMPCGVSLCRGNKNTPFRR